VDLAFGLASSVGPVPFASTSAAVDFALRAHPRFPTVPVTTAPGTSLLAQAVHGIDGVAAVDDQLVATGAPTDPEAAGAAGRRLDSAAFDALRATAEALSDPGIAAPAAVRIPVLGPVTLARALRAVGHPSAAADRTAAEVVAARSVALLRELRSAIARPGSTTAGPVVAVVMCEPGLVGSMHPTFPLLPAEVRGLLDPVVDALDRAAADPDAPADSLLIGVHVPGPADWPTIVGSGASLLCVPVDRSVLGWAPLFGDLLERGGRLCWGAVPVDRPIGSSTEPHWRRLVGLWTSMVAEGVDPMLLRLRSSFSPADGLGHFGPSQAELVMQLTVGVAERVGHQAVAARLSLGA
jgi:hypothetical protein